jgi:hypothetical protein
MASISSDTAWAVYQDPQKYNKSDCDKNEFKVLFFNSREPTNYSVKGCEDKYQKSEPKAVSATHT